MKKKYCGMCSHLKYEDADGLGWCEQWEESDGLGWCEQWEESDVDCGDEACCEFNEKEDEYGQLGSIEGS